MRLFLTTFIWIYISAGVHAGIYANNPPVLNDGELSYLNEYVGKFIIRSEVTGIDGRKVESFDNCTATLVSSRWILTTAHCVYPTPGVIIKNPNEMRFGRRVNGIFEFHRLSGLTVMGNYPEVAHEDWIFLELENELPTGGAYPLIEMTDESEWVSLNGAVKNITYLTFLSPDGSRDETMSSQLMAPSNFCATSRLKYSVFETFPNSAIELGWQDFDKSFFGVSNCPSNLTSSGSPFIDRLGKIRAINAWQRTGYSSGYFGERIINAHLLSRSFYEAYLSIIPKKLN